jgi:hypothetical protein
MGAKLSCPDGFEQGLMFTCHAQCPSEFKYLQLASSTIGPPLEKCVHTSSNEFSFLLNPLPMIEPGNPVPSTFPDELERVKTAASRVKKDVEKQKLLQSSVYNYVQDYERIQSEYSAFKEARSAVDKLKEVKDSLKPFRPPTAPASDLEKERKEITALARRNLYFIQVALFLVVLVMLSYVTLPLETANLIAFALLCVGIALGFFLRK